jgi:riboflavin transporter FmnP
MRTIPYIIFSCIIGWLATSVVYFLLCERLAKWLFAGYDDVALWLGIVMGGLAVIFMVFVSILMLRLRRHKNVLAKQKNE